ncbi:MAG TPA: hypothetical protein DCM28_03255, partial [Phycisphaerales bacterium]|nr:hypothetical protein [Phycisphaerales bacterium]
MPRRIKRSAQGRRNRKSQRKGIRNLLRKRQATPTIFNHELETLEPRVLLTTLVGGDIFEFKAPDPADPAGEGVTIRVIVTGDTIVELIGADVRLEPDGFGGLRQVVNLGDLPGTIYGEGSAAGSDNIEDGIDILGGVGGADGIELLNALNIDPLTGPIILSTPDGTDQIDMQAIASMGLLGNGTTFGINVGQIGTGTGTAATTRQVIQLVQLDVTNDDGTTNNNSTVEAVIQAATLQSDIQSNLVNYPSSLSNPDAYAIDPTTGLAYAVSNEVLYRINRSSGAVTVIGNVSSETLSFEDLGETVSDDVAGLGVDSAGNFLSVYIDSLLNNGLYTSNGSTDPNPQAAILGDYGDSVNLTAIAVDDDPDSPAWGVVENGGTFSLVRFTRISGEIQSITVIGTIQDSLGRNVTEIDSIELESTGDLYVVATRPTVNSAGTREVFRINSNTAVATAVNVVVFADGVLNDDVTGTAIDESNGAENGVLYATVRIGTQDMLIRIDRSIAVSPSDSTADSDDGAVTDNTDGLANDERFLFYSVYDNAIINPALVSSTLDLVPQVTVDSNIAGGGDLLDEYNVLALTVTAQDRLLAVVDEGDGTTGLYEAVRNTVGGPIHSFTKLGSLSFDDGGTDKNILNVQAIESHTTDGSKVYFVGRLDDGSGNGTAVSDDMLFELTFADETTYSVSGSNVLLSGALTTSVFTALAFAHDDSGDLNLYAVRQTASGDQLVSFATNAVGVPEVLSSSITDIAGSSSTNRITALDTYGTSTLVAYRDDSSSSTVERDLVFVGLDGSVEQRLAGGVIDANLNGLAIDADGRVYSVFSSAGTNSQLWQSESFAQVPSLENGDSGTLGDIMDVVALTIGNSGSTYIVTNNDTGFTLEQVTRDAAGIATGVDNLGHITSSVSGSAVIDIAGLDINPASNGLWTVGVDASTLSPDSSLGSLDAIYNVIDVVVTDTLDANQNQRVFALVNNAMSVDMYEIVRLTDGSVDTFSLVGQLSDASGNAVLGSTSIESNSNNSLFVTGYAADSLLEGTATGSQVDSDMLSGQTITQVTAVPGTTNEIYVLTSTGSIYHVNSNGVETLVDQNTVNDIQAIAYDSVQARLLVLGRVDNGTDFNLYAIDAATALDPSTLTISTVTTLFNDQSTQFNTSNSSFAGMTYDSTNNALLIIRNDLVTPANGQFLVTATFDLDTGVYLETTSDTNSIQNGLTAENLNITDLTLHNGVLMGIHISGASQYLTAIDQSDASNSRVLTNSLGGDEIVGLSDNENGNLVVVTNNGTTNTWTLGDAAPTTRLYTINNVNALAADSGVNSASNGTALTTLDGSIVSLAVDEDGDTTVLYAVIQSATDSLQHLVTIDTDNATDDNSVAGTIVDLGAISLNTDLQGTGTQVNPTIVSADIRNGVLVAIATGISSDIDRQLIGVDLQNPDTDSIFYSIVDTLTIDDTLVGLSVDANGNLFSLSNSTTTTRLMTSDVRQALFVVNSTSAVGEFKGTLDDVNGDIVSDSVTALSFSKAGDILYAILRNTDEGQDRIVTISMTDGQVSEIGTSSSIIQVNQANTHIVALETSPTGNLLAYDDSLSTGRRVIQINLEDTETSLQVTTPSTDINDVMGFAVDANGRYFSFNDTATETRLYSSLNSFVAQALFNGGLGAAFDDIADLTINAAGQ